MNVLQESVAKEQGKDVPDCSISTSLIPITLRTSELHKFLLESVVKEEEYSSFHLAKADALRHNSIYPVSAQKISHVM